MNTRPYERYINLDYLREQWRPDTSWSREPALRAMLAGLELSFLLVRHMLADTRPVARSAKRVERTLALIHSQLELLAAHVPHLPAEFAAAQASSDTNLLLCRNGGEAALPAIDYWTRMWLAHLEMPGWRLGLEPQIAELRVSYGLLPCGGEWREPALPYDRLAQPQRLLPLLNEHTFNEEDALFAIVHQVTECWLQVANLELEEQEELAWAADWGQATEGSERVGRILRYLAEHIQLLDTLVLADYHPLRVQLRDASGAQSAQVMHLVQLVRKLLAPIQHHLGDRQASLLKVYTQPRRFPQEHAYLEAFAGLEARLASFFFHHYKLAARVLGTESLGSLGYEVQKLINSFTGPFSSALDRARYDHVVISNFADNQVAGVLTSRLEAVYGETPAPLLEPPAAAAIPAEQAIRRTREYFDALQRSAIDEWLDLFTPDAILADPEGSRPFVGHEGLRIYVTGYLKVLGQDLRIDLAPPHYDAASGVAQVSWTLHTRYKTVPLSSSESARMQFAPDGKICRVTVAQDHSALADILLAQLNQT